MRRMLPGTAVLVLLLLAAPSGMAKAVDDQSALRTSQAAIGTRLGDHAFFDTDHRPVALSDFRGKPLVVNLVYTGCSNACPIVVQNLYPAIEAAQETLGEDAFAVATVGFDAKNDTPERMRAFARTQGVDLPNWHFLSTDQATVDRLAAELGFTVFPSPQGFDHLAQTTIVDAEGEVYRQVYGGGFEVPAVVEPLKDLVLGRASSWTSPDGLLHRVRLFCTLYDPRTERYRFDYSVLIGAAIGLVSLSVVASLTVSMPPAIVRLSRTSVHKEKVGTRPTFLLQLLSGRPEHRRSPR